MRLINLPLVYELTSLSKNAECTISNILLNTLSVPTTCLLMPRLACIALGTRRNRYGCGRRGRHSARAGPLQRNRVCAPLACAFSELLLADRTATCSDAGCISTYMDCLATRSLAVILLPCCCSSGQSPRTAGWPLSYALLVMICCPRRHAIAADLVEAVHAFKVLAPRLPDVAAALERSMRMADAYIKVRIRLSIKLTGGAPHWHSHAGSNALSSVSI